MIITHGYKPHQKSFPSSAEYTQYSELGKQRLLEAVFTHYKKEGFPYYPTEDLWRWEQYQKLLRSDYVGLLEEGGRIRQSMAGLALAWSYMPHSFKVPCNNSPTPYDSWEDDAYFRRILKKVMQLKHPLTMSGLRKVMRMCGTQSVSNFRPTAAACIYHHFGCEGKTVWDMSSGYGGRVLGANLVGVGKYIGTEPCGQTFRGLQEMISDWIDIPTELHQCGSEEYIPKPETLDFCFTSPPYFNTEKYSDEESQSWVQYPSQESWRVGFLKRTMKNCFYGLKPNGKMLINIANVKTYPNLEEDTVRTAKEVGFKYIGEWKLSLSAQPANDDRYKYEPIFIFEKEE